MRLLGRAIPSGRLPGCDQFSVTVVLRFDCGFNVCFSGVAGDFIDNTGWLAMLTNQQVCDPRSHHGR